MIKILLTYDIDNRHGEVKDTMIAQKNYTKVIAGTASKNTNLPNTTLYKTFNPKNITPQEAASLAREELKSVIEDLNKDKTKVKITLERAIAVSFDVWAGIIGAE